MEDGTIGFFVAKFVKRGGALRGACASEVEDGHSHDTGETNPASASKTQGSATTTDSSGEAQSAGQGAGVGESVEERNVAALAAYDARIGRMWRTKRSISTTRKRKYEEAADNSIFVDLECASGTGAVPVPFADSQARNKVATHLSGGNFESVHGPSTCSEEVNQAAILQHTPLSLFATTWLTKNKTKVAS
jgi:hypothetical protein